MTSTIAIPGNRSPLSNEAWAGFLDARNAYIEHQSASTRVSVQRAYQVFALTMGLSLEEARACAARLDAVNGWSQSIDVLVGVAA